MYIFWVGRFKKILGTSETKFGEFIENFFLNFRIFSEIAKNC